MCRRLWKRLFRGHAHSAANIIEEARRRGIAIGEKVHIYSPLPSGRDCFLLSIGNEVTISGNVTFLLHDASIGTASGGVWTDLLGRITIGDKSFIGYGSIILPGVTLPSKTIVGAGSVVTRSPKKEGTIIAGNPARAIGTVDSFLCRNKDSAFNLDGLSQTDIEKLVSSNPDLLLEKGAL